MSLEDRCQTGYGLRVHRGHIFPKVRTRTVPTNYLRFATLTLFVQRLTDSLGKFREATHINTFGANRVP